MLNQLQNYDNVRQPPINPSFFFSNFIISAISPWQYVYRQYKLDTI